MVLDIQLGQTNLISGSTDPTDPVFAESRKKWKMAQKFLYACKKKLIARSIDAVQS